MSKLNDVKEVQKCWEFEALACPQYLFFKAGFPNCAPEENDNIYKAFWPV